MKSTRCVPTRCCRGSMAHVWGVGTDYPGTAGFSLQGTSDIPTMYYVGMYTMVAYYLVCGMVYCISIDLPRTMHFVPPGGASVIRSAVSLEPRQQHEKTASRTATVKHSALASAEAWTALGPTCVLIWPG